MTCGHRLIHYERQCQRTGCVTVTGPQSKLNDTCARCHPPRLIEEINRRHDALRDSLTRQLRQGKTSITEAELQRRIEESGRERRKEIAGVAKMKWNGVVDWGTVVGEEGNERRVVHC